LSKIQGFNFAAFINSLGHPSPNGKTHRQIDHILIYRRRHSGVPDVRSFRGVGCDADHYLVIANVRDRLALNKPRNTKI
jgi:hypothetical protein